MTSSNVVDSTAKPGAGHRRPSRTGRTIGRGLLLLLAGALVVGTGTVVTKPGGHAARQDTTEQARLQAAAQLQELAADFAVLASARGGEILEDTAALLGRQTQLLGAGAGSSGPASSAAATASGDGVVAGVGETTRQLAVVSRSLLSTAQDVEPGLARLLASIGAADYNQARLLQRDTGAPAKLPQAWTAPEASWAGSCAQPGGVPTGPAGKAPGRPTTADALGAVIVSERKLAYVYEAALPRLAGSAREAARKRYLQHRGLIDSWENTARGLCVQVPPAEAAYELPAGLAAGPGPVLAAVEAGAPAAFTDLVAFSSGTLRARASADLLTAVQRIADTAGTVPAAPGLESVAAPAARPSAARPSAAL